MKCRGKCPEAAHQLPEELRPIAARRHQSHAKTPSESRRATAWCQVPYPHGSAPGEAGVPSRPNTARRRSGCHGVFWLVLWGQVTGRFWTCQPCNEYQHVSTIDMLRTSRLQGSDAGFSLLIQQGEQQFGEQDGTSQF